MRNFSMSVKKYSKSITVRIIVIMILLVIPLNIWGIVTAAHIQQSMYTESRNNIYGVGQLAMKDLDSRINSVDYYLFNTLQNSNNFFPLVRQQKGDEAFYHAAYNLHSDFFDRASFGRDAEMYFFYTKDVGYIDLAAGTNYSRMRQELQSDIKDMIDKGTYKKSNKWQLIELRDELWLLRCRNQRSLYYGALIHIGNIYDNLYNSLKYETVKLLMSETDAAEEIEDEKKLYVTCTSENASIYLNIYVDKSEIADSLPFYRRLGTMMSFVFLCVLPLLILFVYHYLLRPVNILVKSMNRVRDGEWTYQIKERPNSNEFKELYDNFNTMVTAQVKMGEEFVEKETYGKKMELQTLQMQIRPHFLLNSFNLLYGLVTMKKIESAQRMILYLSDYFRYIFRSGKELELYSRELSMIVNYIDVARLRYPFIAFEETHDEDVLYVEVPPLLIHNFIENVLKHGLNVKGMTHIRLTAGYSQGRASFVIEDDGRGMPEDVVELLNQGIFQKDGEPLHVGLKNAYHRIQYFYGQGSLLQVESVLGEGTKILIEIPCELNREDNENEGVDS